MFGFDDKDNDLEREAEELRENYSSEDRIKLGEHIERRIECLEIEKHVYEYSDSSHTMMSYTKYQN